MNRKPEMEVTMDVGIVPEPHEHEGKYVVTIQICPLDDEDEAEYVAKQIVDVINERLKLKMYRMETLVGAIEDDE